MHFASLSSWHDPGGLRPIGALSARFWRAKLYASAAEAPGLRAEDLAAAGRIYRAGIAAPGVTRVAGFGLLRFGDEVGGLVLSVCWWEVAMLHRVVWTLPGSGGVPGRRGDAAERVGGLEEVLLMGREAMAWRRHVLDTSMPSIDGYLSECCA